MSIEKKSVAGLLCILFIGAAARAGTWINDVSSDGEIITTADGAIWKVAAIDRFRSMLWLPVDNITVFRTNQIGVYVLLNTSQRNERVTAQYLGQK